MKDRIRELLAYSFMDNGQVIPYINLTAREKLIITEDEYDEVIMFIRGEIDLYSPPRRPRTPETALPKTIEQKMRTLLKIILMLFVIEVATSLVMCTIGSLYNFPGTGTFAEVFKAVLVTLATTTGAGIILFFFTLIVYPNTLD